jgi:aminomethyltransferase
VDDIIVYRRSDTEFWVVFNAGCLDKDRAWFQGHTAGFDVVIDDITERTGLLAVQGPAAMALLGDFADSHARFGIGETTFAGIPITAARTGYTGEDGFEVFCPAGRAVKSWNDILGKGAAFAIKPCGLGARDTLRLEMCYPLNGSDLGADTTPIEAGLGIFVDLQKPDFIGRQKLADQKEQGVKRRLVPFKMTGASPPPRSHYAVFKGGKKIAETTSGSLSPTLKAGIGMAYIPTEFARINEQIEIEIRGQRFPATIEKKPLHRPNTATN